MVPVAVRAAVDLLSSRLRTDTCLRYFGRKAGAERPQTTGGIVRGAGHLITLAEKLEAGGWDCFVQLNPSIRGTGRWRARAEDVPALHWIFVDVDSPTPLGIHEQMDVVHEVEQSVALEGVVTGAAVFSGRGVQFWIPTPAVPVDGKPGRVQHVVSNFLRRLQSRWGAVHGTKIDTSTSDLPRVARLPGTVNTKSGRTASFIYQPSWSELGHENLWESLVAAAPQYVPPPPPPETGAGDLRKVFHLLSNRAKQFLIEGAPEGSRHQAIFATAASLRDLGFPQDEALVLLRKGNAKCSEPLDDGEVLYGLHSAYKKGGAS